MFPDMTKVLIIGGYSDISSAYVDSVEQLTFRQKFQAANIYQTIHFQVNLLLVPFWRVCQLFVVATMLKLVPPMSAINTFMKKTVGFSWQNNCQGQDKVINQAWWTVPIG